MGGLEEGGKEGVKLSIKYTGSGGSGGGRHGRG